MALNPYAAPYFSCYSNSISSSQAFMNQTNIYYSYPPPQHHYYNNSYIPFHGNIYQYHYFPTKHFTIHGNSPAAEAWAPPPPPPLPLAESAEPEEVVKELVVETTLKKKKPEGFYSKYGDFASVPPPRKRTGCSRPRRSVRREDDEGFRFREECCWKTTVMIKNIPNKMNKNELLEILDAHCMKENQKILAGDRGDDVHGRLSEFDFLYLPMDFSSGSNLGYAFLNFTSARAAWRLHNDLHNTSWNKYGSRKVCEITYARLQGLSSLEAHFKNSVFNCESDDYLPVIFAPCRNGLGPSQCRLVAKRIHGAKN